MKSKEYDVIRFEDGMATINIERTILEDSNGFKKKLINIINDAIYVNEQINELYSEE